MNFSYIRGYVQNEIKQLYRSTKRNIIVNLKKNGFEMKKLDLAE